MYEIKMLKALDFDFPLNPSFTNILRSPSFKDVLNIVCQPVYCVYSFMLTNIYSTVSAMSQLALRQDYYIFYHYKIVIVYICSCVCRAVCPFSVCVTHRAPPPPQLQL
jgi:hypothetical protein